MIISRSVLSIAKNRTLGLLNVRHAYFVITPRRNEYAAITPRERNRTKRSVLVDDGVDVRKYTLRERCMYVCDEGWVSECAFRIWASSIFVC